DNIIITFNHRHYRPLSKSSSKIVLIDSSPIAFELAKKEDILYHIGYYEEAPSVLYNAILDFNVLSDDNRESIESGVLNLKVLVAEDYEMNRILIEEMLSIYSITPDFAFNGLEVIEKIQNKDYDIIFMDINMPELNGTDATKILREDYFLTTPIVALTANALEGDRERFLAQGMDDYISKPIDIKLLDNILKKYQYLNSDSLSLENDVDIKNKNKNKNDDDDIKSETFVNALVEAKNSMHFSSAIIARLFSSFIPHALSNITQLKEAFEKDDKKVVYERAHALRGIALSLKFITIAEPCDKIEYGVKDNIDINYEELILKVEKNLKFVEEHQELIISKLKELD
ncbi:MAG: response regulator, partial [Sulfurovaceae bacterium]|nr:response regulator [Sulfurovaceae bacterium]